MSRSLVAYFSASGVTREKAELLAQAAGADLYVIKPAVPYTSADLDWQNNQSRSSIEMADTSSRPALADKTADISAYDTIFLGFPIWWNLAPTIINTFLESCDFSGKTIVLFATSGGSDFGDTAFALKKSVPDSTVIKEGMVLNGSQNVQKISEMLKALGL